MSLSSEAKGLLKGIPIFSALGAAIGFVFVPSTVDVTTFANVFQLQMNINFVIGLAIGAVLSALKVIILEKTVDKALSHENAVKAKMYMHLTYIPRFLFTVATLAISVVFFGLFGILGALVGNISLTLSAYLIKVISHKKSGKDNLKERSE